MGSDWLFPSVIGNGGHILGSSLNHALIREQEVIGVDPFSPHDLRRTGSTGMTAMRIDYKWVDKVLNHVPENLRQVYDRHLYLPEKREALENWGRKLESMITGKKGKVISITRKAKGGKSR